MSFLLSICIPTFNRAGFLSATIDAVVSDPEFAGNEIEIIVSDNASTDDTPGIMKQYLQRFPGKIRYIRKEKAIDSHFNFQNALDHGTGKYLKLMNDTSVFLPGKLSMLCGILKEHPETDVLITNFQTCHTEKLKKIESVNDAVSYCSFFITWISSYTYKRSLYAALTEPFRYYQYYFPQEDIFFRILERGGTAYVSNERFFERLRAKYNSKVRNEALIYGDCYLTFLKKYVDSGRLEPPLFEREKFDVLFWHILPIYFDFDGTFFGGETLGYKLFWKSTPQYHCKLYFYFAIAVAFLYRNLLKIPGIRKLMIMFKDLVKSFTRNKLAEAKKN